MIGEAEYPDYEQHPLGRGSVPKCSQGRNHLAIEPKTITQFFQDLI